MHNFLRASHRKGTGYWMYALMSDFKVMLLNCHVSLVPRPETTRLSPCQQSKAATVSLDGRGPSAWH